MHFEKNYSSNLILRTSGYLVLYLFFLRESDCSSIKNKYLF